MTTPLAGLTVVVTRPDRQAGPFMRLLQESGATPVAFPTLAIDPVALDEATRERWAPDAYDWLILTSANAVANAFAQLPHPRRARVAAIGRATARSLQELGIEVHATPASVSDSESLLAMPELANVRGQRILVLKGTGGRDQLRKVLTARGAEVTLAEVYRRRVATPGRAALEDLQRACAAAQPVVAVTSVEVLDALLDLAPQAAHPHLRDCVLLLPGVRVAAAARERGWRGHVVVAPSAEDATMVDALARAHADGGMTRPA